MVGSCSERGRMRPAQAPCASWDFLFGRRGPTGPPSDAPIRRPSKLVSIFVRVAPSAPFLVEITIAKRVQRREHQSKYDDKVCSVLFHPEKRALETSATVYWTKNWFPPPDVGTTNLTPVNIISRSLLCLQRLFEKTTKSSVLSMAFIPTSFCNMPWFMGAWVTLGTSSHVVESTWKTADSWWWICTRFMDLHKKGLGLRFFFPAKCNIMANGHTVMKLFTYNLPSSVAPSFFTELGLCATVIHVSWHNLFEFMLIIFDSEEALHTKYTWHSRNPIINEGSKVQDHCLKKTVSHAIRRKTGWVCITWSTITARWPTDSQKRTWTPEWDCCWTFRDLDDLTSHSLWLPADGGS